MPPRICVLSVPKLIIRSSHVASCGQMIFTVSTAWVTSVLRVFANRSKLVCCLWTGTMNPSVNCYIFCLLFCSSRLKYMSVKTSYFLCGNLTTFLHLGWIACINTLHTHYIKYMCIYRRNNCPFILLEIELKLHFAANNDIGPTKLQEKFLTESNSGFITNHDLNKLTFNTENIIILSNNFLSECLWVT